MEVLRARERMKDELRMRGTTFKVANNNPLKFSANVDDAFHNLFVKHNPAYLDPAAAFEDAFRDVRDHQAAFLSAMRLAFESMLSQLDPNNLQDEFDRQIKGLDPRRAGEAALLGSVSRQVLRAREGCRNRLPPLFGDAFARAYEEQLERLQGSQPVATNNADRGSSVIEDTLVEEDIHPRLRFRRRDRHGPSAHRQSGRVRANSARRGVWAVADGMGGYRDGDVASRMVCEGLAEHGQHDFARRRHRCHSPAHERGQCDAASGVDSRARSTHRQWQHRRRLLVVQRTAALSLWAGDSRIYRLRHKRLTQLTTDHTWAVGAESAATERRSGPRDHARGRRRRHAAAGCASRSGATRRPLLLCSDGLTRELTDAQIAELMSGDDVQQCAKALIDATLQAGARDNVTVVVIEAT